MLYLKQPYPVTVRDTKLTAVAGTITLSSTPIPRGFSPRLHARLLSVVAGTIVQQSNTSTDACCSAMLPDAMAASAQEALHNLRDALQARQQQQGCAGSSALESSSINTALSQLAQCLQDLLQRQSSLEQSLEDRCVPHLWCWLLPSMSAKCDLQQL
jgi:hypothetical protein